MTATPSINFTLLLNSFSDVSLSHHLTRVLSNRSREEVGQSISDLHTAGVKVVMVTGDHPLTAEAIGRKIGLITLPSIIIQDDEDFLEKISKMDSLINRDRLSPSQDDDQRLPPTKTSPLPSEHHSDGMNSERLSEQAQKNYAVIVLGNQPTYLHIIPLNMLRPIKISSFQFSLYTYRHTLSTLTILTIFQPTLSMYSLARHSYRHSIPRRMVSYH